ncbi:MAG: DUF1707 domain-containing protein [Candidatus Nanopelagicales bacterium]
MGSVPDRDAVDPHTTSGTRPMRASDQDRTEAVLALTDHVTDGRLDSDEFEARVSAAYAATYLHELDPLFADLPYSTPRPAAATDVVAPGRGSASSGRRARGGRAAGRERFGGRRPVFAPLLVLAVVAGVAITSGHLWLLIPVAWFAVTAPHRRAWRHQALAAQQQRQALGQRSHHGHHGRPPR